MRLSLQLSKQLALLGMLLSFALPMGALAVDMEPSPETNKHHYTLVMSEDDKVCKPLAKLYNQMLGEFAAKKRPSDAKLKACSDKDPQKDCSNGYFQSTFEAQYPDRFKRIGFTTPPQTPHSPVQGIYFSYLVDLFDEGKPRIIRLYDRPYGMTETETRVDILKNGVTEYQFQENGVVDRDAGLEGLMKLQEKQFNRRLIGYFLTKWPGFEKTYKDYLSDEEKIKHQIIKGIPPQDWPHKIGGGPLSIRIFLHSDHLYFILNEFIQRPQKPKTNYTSTVLVYQLTKTGADDICYLNSEDKP